jgi:hypothetical protein
LLIKVGGDIMGKVEFKSENIAKCLCPTCPVQGKSDCVKDKLKKVQELMSEDVDLASMVEPADVPGVYCANGRASCGDLYFHEICQCTNCSVFKENKLAEGEPVGYYCRDGEAR